MLSAMSIYGGPIRRIETPFTKVFPEDISRDGTKLLVLSYDGIEAERSLWVLPLHDGIPQRVENVWCHSAAWSSDGRTVAYAKGNAIYITQDLGIGSRELRSFDGVPRNLRWSPDERRIRFVLEDPATSELSPWELELKDSLQANTVGAVQLPLKDCCGAWNWVHGRTVLLLWLIEEIICGWLREKILRWARFQRPIEVGTTPGLIFGVASDRKRRRSVLLGMRKEASRTISTGSNDT